MRSGPCKEKTEVTPAASPQFGAPDLGVAYRDRPAAFGVAEREDGMIALVRVTPPGAAWLDLPGGALDPGEGDEQALVREFGEETGLIVRPGPRVTRASQYFRLNDGEPVNNRCAVFQAVVEGFDPALKIEDDHELVWMKPREAAEQVRHDAHAWAILHWLRARLDRPAGRD